LNPDQITYLVFIVVIIIALLLDLGFLSKKNTIISTKTALIQTIIWVCLAFAFFIFMWYQEGKVTAVEYLSAYLMEWSLSIDNIFVFIIIFSAFKVQTNYYARVLLIGILMAIIFRIVFITLGIALVQKAQWTLYLFGLFLVYTGYKMYSSDQENEFNPQQSKVYKWLLKYLPITLEDGGGKFLIRKNGKSLFTSLFVVVIMISITDLVFALDSIPAVLGISRNNLVIYTSNIFAVLGLRSLFFLLKGAVSKFDYLQQGIALVLIFIGLKMIFEHYLEKWINKNEMIFISLLVIVISIIGSILYSIQNNKKNRN
jgi:tellurite resistance protein TerC